MKMNTNDVFCSEYRRRGLKDPGGRIGPDGAAQPSGKDRLTGEDRKAKIKPKPKPKPESSLMDKLPFRKKQEGKKI